MTEHVSRRSVLAGLGAVAVAGCIDDGGGSTGGDGLDDGGPSNDRGGTPQGTPAPPPADLETVFVGGNPPDDEPANAPPFADRELPLPMVPDKLSDHAVDGGPPQDGIPSIDDPDFLDASEADAQPFLDDDTVVLAVAGEEDVKAYTRRVLVQHEIVNDTIDGTPVAVTYCPLTGTAQGFVRGDTEFGVSGMLINNNLIMHDRERERWWPQIPAVSIPGPWDDSPGGAALEEFRVIRTTWGRWKREHPETVLMSENTDFARDYDRDPYQERGYYGLDGTIFENLYEDPYHHAKEWVYGIRSHEGSAVFVKAPLREQGIVEGKVGETPHLAVYDPDLDTAYVYRNPDEESFTYDDVETDDDSGEVVDGDGEGYAPDDLLLERVLAFDAYWFAWTAYYPDRAVHE